MLSSTSRQAFDETKKKVTQHVFKEEELEMHRVSFGETYDSIALKHDMTAVELRRANPGVNFSSQAIPGQELRVKKKSQQFDLLTTFDCEKEKEKDLNSNEEEKSSEKVNNIENDGMLERSVLLCLGNNDKVPGRLIIGSSAGFVLFEPSSSTTSTSLTTKQVKMLFALDTRDISGCASVSRISSRLEDSSPCLLLQIVWKNPDLGFRNEQQVFFEVATEDILTLVDAIYSSNKVSTRSATLTSGIPALRIIEEVQKSSIIEGFVSQEISSPSLKTSSSFSQLLLEESTKTISELSFSPSFSNQRVTMIPRESNLVTPDEVYRLVEFLPERLQGCTWNMIYDFNDHGISLHALFAAAKQHRETMLFVRDVDSKEICGTFTAEPWDPQGRNGFFGTGETFVFRISSATPPEIEVFRWSGVNEFFQTCSTNHLAVGGGGNFALCLDNDLEHCTSGPCLTFDGLENRALSSFQSFRIDALELWCFEQFAKPRSSTLSSCDEFGSSPYLKNREKIPVSPRIKSYNSPLSPRLSLPPRIVNNNDDEYVKL